MHGQDLHQWSPAAVSQGSVPWICLVSGTGDGPPLAKALLQRGWNVLVCVVTATAARAYTPHPHLQIRVGAFASDAELEAVLQRWQPRWCVDATHPFACEISQRLERVCQGRQQGLLRLERCGPAGSEQGTDTAPPALALQPLQDLKQLRDHDWRGQRLLLAIGSRQLPQALAHSAGAIHFARVLDHPSSVQLALAAGLSDAHLACLRPDPSGSGEIEQALCRRWRISSVLCRRGGGRSERLWRKVCQELGLRLLLLDPPRVSWPGLPFQALLEKLGDP